MNSQLIKMVIRLDLKMSFGDDKLQNDIFWCIYFVI